MAVLPREATYGEFREYVVGLRGVLSCAELDELWERRQRLLGLGFVTGRGYRSMLPPEEQDMTREERGRKAERDARSQGRNIERLPDKATF
jgi:hypothetical protein